ncbi:pyridoxamine 5'-phosphate oxidase family protein [Campylobacterota bacterium DY0563]|uniref:pyridoxamine 5'-phosphate oxidase family protein n=1 Tax=Halarcobacter sp. TaxID=2321133 RepID=UPI0029F474EB|nr:pyridoxamine 5'-phosphate oxidase family protein [Halarcobacter sp.]
MGKQYKQLTKEDIDFIKKQKLFYIASCSDAEVNLSPKAYDSIAIAAEDTILFLSYPGSTNRTQKDVLNDGKITLLFNAFEGDPYLLRIFCKANIIDKDSDKFQEYLKYFTLENQKVRDIFEFKIQNIESNCGLTVPIMEYKGDRKS